MSKTLQTCLQEAQSHFNRREYIQFILPIVQTLENTNKQLVNKDVYQKLDVIVNDVLDSLLNDIVSVDSLDYILYNTLRETLLKELQIHQI